MGYATSPQGTAAITDLAEQGLYLPPIPDSEDQPMLPEDLSDLDDTMLMNEYSLFSSWADYAEAQLSLAVITEREAERDLEWATGVFWSDQPRTRSVTAIKAEAAQEPSIRHAQETFDKAQAYRRMVASVLNRYERDANVLSRELTRRTQGEAKSRRRDRWEA